MFKARIQYKGKLLFQVNEVNEDDEDDEDDDIDDDFEDSTSNSDTDDDGEIAFATDDLQISINTV